MSGSTKERGSARMKTWINMYYTITLLDIAVSPGFVAKFRARPSSAFSSLPSQEIWMFKMVDPLVGMLEGTLLGTFVLRTHVTPSPNTKWLKSAGLKRKPTSELRPPHPNPASHPKYPSGDLVTWDSLQLGGLKISKTNTLT